MSRYKVARASNQSSGEFPHIVEMLVPLGGFGKHLDAMYHWHRARGIEDHHGRGRHDENGRNHIRWCFGNPEIATEFG
jgi:hypothetical protein